MIIGIIGKKRSGKDTVAKILLSYEAFSHFEIRKFATPLRKVLHEITGITVEESETDEGKAKVIPECNMTTGRALQLIGETMRNTLWKNVWVDTFYRNWKADGIPDVIISDVRHINEANFINKHGILIRVNRPFESNEGILNDGRDPSHCSEIEQDLIEADVIINNIGDLDQLKKAIPTSRRLIEIYHIKELDNSDVAR
jgi:hypothetical protein